MKRIKILVSASLLLMSSVVFGQTEKTISAMKEGTTLSAADIGFLSMVSNAAVEANRGAGEKIATIGKTSYSAGKVLTKADATAISAAVKSFQKTYKAPDASRGAGLCWYWYYYCDGWGYCYWYKYWYYC